MYFDAGASQLIIDGKVGLKNDSVVKEFTESGSRFGNGSALEADLVVFASAMCRYHSRHVALRDEPEVQDGCHYLEPLLGKCRRVRKCTR